MIDTYSSSEAFGMLKVPYLPFLHERRAGLAVFFPGGGWAGLSQPSCRSSFHPRSVWPTSPEAATALWKLMADALLAMGSPHPTPWAWLAPGTQPLPSTPTLHPQTGQPGHLEQGQELTADSELGLAEAGRMSSALFLFVPVSPTRSPV